MDLTKNETIEEMIQNFLEENQPVEKKSSARSYKRHKSRSKERARFNEAKFLSCVFYSSAKTDRKGLRNHGFGCNVPNCYTCRWGKIFNIEKECNKLSKFEINQIKQLSSVDSFEIMKEDATDERLYEEFCTDTENLSQYLTEYTLSATNEPLEEVTVILNKEHYPDLENENFMKNCKTEVIVR